MNILIVDDNQDNLEMLEIVLGSNNYNIISATNGKQALELLHIEKIDLIISDILMPVMDGFQLCKECRFDEKFKKIPFIFYTATYIDELDEDFALSLGAQAFIRKPQEPDVFLEIIKEIIHKSEVSELKVDITTEPDEKEVLKLYSERLISKLEKKNLDLENEIDAHKKTVQALTAAKEKAEEADRLKSAFLANISHEIRTPMNSINGFSNLLLDPTISESEIKEFAEYINNACARLLTTVNNVLDISKIDAGQMDLQEKEFNVSYLIKEIYDLHYQHFAHKGLQFSMHVANELKGINIIGDEQKIYQVLNNLLRNALKFTNEGRVNFGCDCVEGSLKFYIKDTGIGISKDAQELIFGRFNQENFAYNSGYEGTGLGLSISKGLVELMGGKLEVLSDKGLGSTFHFTLPIKCKDAIPTPSIKKTLQKIVTNKPKNISVLIADDDITNFMLLRSILRLEMIENVAHAANGLEAVDLYNKIPNLSMILMDIKMPIMDGLQATRKIRENNKKIPIVAITAYNTKQDKETALDAGCNDYITKPYQQQALMATLRKYVDL